ncbi:MAG: hypothetical protein RL071_1508 [Pseudomonadota bacterium]
MSGASRRPFLTTARAGELLGVTAPTVIAWINQGSLHAHLTPGGHRRIEPAELQRFAAQRGLLLKALAPVAAPPGAAPDAVLLWDSERDYADTVAEFVAMGLGLLPVVVDDLVELSFQLGRTRPRAVVVEWGLLEAAGLQRLKDLVGPGPRWVACLPMADAAASQRAITFGFHLTIHRGQPMGSVVEALRP